MLTPTPSDRIWRHRYRLSRRQHIGARPEALPRERFSAMLIIELKQYVNEVRPYHGRRKIQLTTDSTSLSELLRSVRSGAGPNQAEMAPALYVSARARLSQKEKQRQDCNGRSECHAQFPPAVSLPQRKRAPLAFCVLISICLTSPAHHFPASQPVPACRQSPHIRRRASSSPILPAHTARDKHASTASLSPASSQG